MKRWLRSLSQSWRMASPSVQLTRRLNDFVYSRLPVASQLTEWSYTERKLRPSRIIAAIYSRKEIQLSYTAVTLRSSRLSRKHSTDWVIRLMSYTERPHGTLSISRYANSNVPKSLERWHFRFRLGPSLSSSAPEPRWLFIRHRTDGKITTNVSSVSWARIRRSQSVTPTSWPAIRLTPL